MFSMCFTNIREAYHRTATVEEKEQLQQFVDFERRKGNADKAITDGIKAFTFDHPGFHPHTLRGYIDSPIIPPEKGKIRHKGGGRHKTLTNDEIEKIKTIVCGIGLKTAAGRMRGLHSSFFVPLFVLVFDKNVWLMNIYIVDSQYPILSY